MRERWSNFSAVKRCRMINSSSMSCPSRRRISTSQSTITPSPPIASPRSRAGCGARLQQRPGKSGNPRHRRVHGPALAQRLVARLLIRSIVPDIRIRWVLYLSHVVSVICHFGRLRNSGTLVPMASERGEVHFRTLCKPRSFAPLFSFATLASPVRVLFFP